MFNFLNNSIHHRSRCTVVPSAFPLKTVEQRRQCIARYGALFSRVHLAFLRIHCCRYHDVASSREYEALLRETLRQGAVDEEGRAALRRHRVANGIDSLHHLRVLTKLGWTLDDLEEGRKMDPPTADDPATGAKPLVQLEESLSPRMTQLGKDHAALSKALRRAQRGGDTSPSS